jgi:predicted  nucleic acid-binding Zn-ribbon protein
MRSDARRLERGADDKRARAEKMDQRLTRVSNLREEAAVRTELDLIRRAIEADEQEALQLIDQIRRLELTEEELDARTSTARAEVGPRQDALLSDRASWQSRLSDLQNRRSEALGTVAHLERRVYDSFHQSGRSVVVASLLEDGACGHCFGVIPLQIQNEVRRAEGLIRCEACGVILTTEPEPELDPSLVEPLSSASTDDEAGDLEGEPVEEGMGESESGSDLA